MTSARRLGLIVLFAAGASTAPHPMASSAPSAPCFNFSGTAAADGARTTFGSSAAALFGVMDAEGPATRVHVDSLGNSAAWAGAPYPGDTGLFFYRTATRPAGAPDYPAMAATRHPSTTEAKTSVPPYELTARSDALAGDALAKGGQGEDTRTASTAGKSVVRATVACDAAEDTVTASAENDTEALSFAGGVFRMGRVRSVATVVVDASGERHVASRLDVGQASVAGQAVTITEDGVAAGGSTTPLPAADPASQVLRDAGVQVTYVKSVPQPDGKGVVAPGVMVSVHTADGSQVSYTFGRAYATAESEPSSALPEPPPGTTTPATTAGPVADTLGTSSGSDGVPVVDEFAAPSPGPAPTGGTRAPVVGAQQPVSFAVPGLSLAGLYLALVVGAVLLLTAASLIRKIGVKLQWI